METEIASGLEEEHFIAHRRGKSWPSVIANLFGAAWSISEVARRDGEQRSAALQQHFIVQRRDKSWPNGVADFPEIISQKFDFLKSCSVDFNEKRTKWS